MSKPKNPPIKKVIVTRRSPAMKKAGDKVTYAHDTKATCQNSAVFSGSPALQAGLLGWVSSADALGDNLAKQAVARNLLIALEADVPGLMLDCDNGEAEFATCVQKAAKEDVSVAIGMGMSVKADKTPTAEAVVPTGVRIELYKKTNAPKLAWNAVLGAVVYLAQMSTAPATETSWIALYGKGRNRTLPPLIADQHYVLRVGALDNQGKPTGWSDEVSLVG